LKAWDKIPAKVIVISDGSWDLKDGARYIDFWPGEIIFESWHESAQYHKNKGRNFLYSYASGHVFGKKLSAILRHGELGPTIYADTDVLWFKSPFKELDTECALRLTIDNSYNYDLNLVTILNGHSVLIRPPINAGVVYINGNMFLRSTILEHAIEIVAGKPDHFSEQTILALLADELGATWPLERITASIDDIFWPLYPSYKRDYKNLIARHYVWAMKWLFWRDYYLLYS
jgi:hypothetical protein